MPNAGNCLIQCILLSKVDAMTSGGESSFWQELKDFNHHQLRTAPSPHWSNEFLFLGHLKPNTNGEKFAVVQDPQLSENQPLFRTRVRFKVRAKFK